MHLWRKCTVQTEVINEDDSGDENESDDEMELEVGQKANEDYEDEEESNVEDSIIDVV